jgi:hypothetical protein
LASRATPPSRDRQAPRGAERRAAAGINGGGAAEPQRRLAGPQHAGPQHAGPQHAGPGAAPVSRFFKTGPSSLLGNRSAASPHGVGSGPASGSLYNSHQPGALAPAVGYGHDASQEQAHGRNEAVYQAPFSAAADLLGRQVPLLCVLRARPRADEQGRRDAPRRPTAR